MSKYSWHICSFGSTDDLKGKDLTYENVKSIVLKVGRFSTFEATATMRHAHIFTQLCKDPEIETFDMGFPWTGVRLRNRDEEKKEAVARDEKKAEAEAARPRSSRRRQSVHR